MLTLVTRPEPAAARTLARLAALGHDVLFDPMLEIRPRATRLPEGPFQALTFTSINGVQGFMAQQNISAIWPRLRTLPVYTVGPRTAEEARQTGFDHVIDCDGDARDLTARMKAELPAGTRILYPAGEHRAADLPAALAPAGMVVDIAVVYAAEGVDALSTQTRAALAEGRVACILHFSRRTVLAFLACVAKAGLENALCGPRHLCLAAQVAGPLVERGLAVELADAPNEEALFALL